jgi:putative salt-induced outer membrane protein
MNQTIRAVIAKQIYAGSRRAIALAAVWVCVGSGLTAAESAAPAEAPKGWDITAAASATLTRGNSETFLATLSLDAKRKWERDEATLGVSGGYGETTVDNVDSKNTEFVQGYGQYNRLFNDRIYGGLRLDGQYDGIAGVDYRVKLSPMAGYYLIKNDKMTLAAEGGPSLILEHLNGQPSTAYWSARLAEHFEYKLTETTKVWESLAYLPKVDDWAANYLLNFEVGIDTAINKQWSLRMVFQDMFASEPANGREQNDIRLLAGTAYKF